MAGVPVPAACASTRRRRSDGGMPRCLASRKAGTSARVEVLEVELDRNLMED